MSLVRFYNRGILRTFGIQFKGNEINAKLSTEPSKDVQNVAESIKDKSENDVHDVLRRRTYVPTDFERKVLVWVGRYKTVEDIPKAVPTEVFEKARNKARIKISNYMMLATAVACVFIAISGKRAAERGESVTKMNLDWHRSMKEAKEK